MRARQNTAEPSPTKKIKTEQSQDHFKKLVLNGDYVDKTKFIKELEKVNLTNNAIVCFRPRRWGKSITLSMLKNYYDVKTVNENTFQNLYIGKNPTNRAHQYLVLMLDFSGIDMTSYEAFITSLNNNLNDDMQDFQRYYREELQNQFQINPDDAISTFNRLLDSVTRGQTLYVLVDEYDASVNEVLGNLQYNDPKADEKTQKIEIRFNQIFSKIKKASQKGAYVFVTEVTPLAFSGFNNVSDITMSSEFAEMYGFTENEVKEQLNFIPDELNLVDDIAETKSDLLHNPDHVLNQDGVEWRDGTKPDYTVQQEAFAKGKTRDHAPDSLEAIVQCLVKNFEKEASNLKDPKAFQTIDQEKFRIINNGGTSYDVKKMVEIGTYNVFLEDCPKELYDPKCTFEKSHEMFHKRFSKSFAWEVIQVFSGPPTLSFSWRHFGEYSGPYKDN